jgi:DNA-binding MarR family transcriptional regulator
MAIQDLYDKPGYQIRRLRQIAAGMFAAQAATFDITGQQWTTLQALGEFERLEQNELCDILVLDRATMATLLVRLEEKGLVRRRISERDRRRKHVSLTPSGRRTLVEMAPVIERIQKRILEPLTAADRVEFARMLRKLVDSHSAPSGQHASTQEEAS